MKQIFYMLVFLLCLPALSFGAAGVGFSTWTTLGAGTLADGDLWGFTDVSDVTGSDDGSSKSHTGTQLATYMQSALTFSTRATLDIDTDDNVVFSTVNLTGANGLSLGTATTANGNINFKNSTNSFYFDLSAGVFGANFSWTLPTAQSSGANYLLNVDADGTMGYTSPASFEVALGDPGTNGYVLSSLTDGTRSWIANGAGAMTYPDAGIPLSTGSAWGTSYSLATLKTAMTLDLNDNYVWTGNHTFSGGTVSLPASITLPDDSVDSDQVVAGAIDDAHMAASSVDLATNTVTGVLPAANIHADIARDTEVATAVDAIVNTKCVTISAATAASDFMVESFSYAITITEVRLNQLGGTNVVGMFDENDSAGANPVAIDSSDLTATTAQVEDTAPSNAGIDANDVISWRTTSVSGTNTQMLACFDYTVD